MPNARSEFFGAAFVGILLLAVSSPASGQKITLGVIAGASLTEDFRNESFTFGPGLATHASNASQWFMFGPTIDFAFSKRVSVEVDAIRRRIRSSEVTTFPEREVLPGITISQLSPSLNDGFTWQLSALGKYKLPTRPLKPFFELGSSFRPQENRDQTGITTGAGVELNVGRARLTPTLRYTRWLTDNGIGAVPDQLQFVVGLHEASDSRRPTLLGRPLSLGFVAGAGITKLLKDRSHPESPFGTTSDSPTPIAGIRIGFPVSDNIAVEVDGLFRGTHILNSLLPDGSIKKNAERIALLTWQFPVLAKYKIPVRKASPVIELGPAFRIIAHTTGSEDYSHYGVAGGLGVSKPIGKVTVSPTIRYTRWERDKTRFGSGPEPGTRPDQVEVVVGFSF